MVCGYRIIGNNNLSTDNNIQDTENPFQNRFYTWYPTESTDETFLHYRVQAVTIRTTKFNHTKILSSCGREHYYSNKVCHNKYKFCHYSTIPAHDITAQSQYGISKHMPSMGNYSTIPARGITTQSQPRVSKHKPSKAHYNQITGC